jgi:glycine/D-amino acid oxidase-like deaminating enzyme
MPVVVLRAGAVRVATALYLSEAGHDIVVVDREDAALPA